MSIPDTGTFPKGHKWIPSHCHRAATAPRPTLGLQRPPWPSPWGPLCHTAHPPPPQSPVPPSLNVTNTGQ